MVLNEEKSEEKTGIKSEEKSDMSSPNPKRIRWALPGRHMMVHLLITFELPTRLLGDQTVSIVVGAEKRAFAMHKMLLCSSSDYFRAALDGGFKEAAEQRIELLEDNPKVFERFQLWLYTGNVFDRGEKSTALDHSVLVDIYVFAESRCIPGLQNHLVDTIIRKSAREHFYLRPSDGDMYSNTVSSSPLRELAVYIAAHIRGLGHSSWKLNRYPKEFLVALVLALHNKSGLEKDSDPKATLWENRCKYHVHLEDEPLCPTGKIPSSQDSSEDEQD